MLLDTDREEIKKMIREGVTEAIAERRKKFKMA